jgi:hypothetical protein
MDEDNLLEEEYKRYYAEITKHIDIPEIKYVIFSCSTKQEEEK